MNRDIKTVLTHAANRLAASVDLPDLEAQLLLSHVLQKPRTWLLAWPEALLDEAQWQAFEELLERRLSGEPVAHLTGEREFWTQDLEVTPDTLIPRPETEMLVETVLERFDNSDDIDLLDLGTGTGAIAIAIASERPGWNISATDYSQKALAVARRNAEKSGVNINFYSGHWFNTLPEGIRFDIIVCNPPYIPEEDPHLKEGDVRFEPRSALVAGKDGLDDIRHLVAESPRFLKKEGLLLLEHGYDQSEAVQALMAKAGLRDITTLNDLAGQPRVTFGRCN